MVLIAMDRVRLALLILAVLAVEIHGKTSSKKSLKELEHPAKKETNIKKPAAQKAIIAIEIVDPKDNSTKLGKGRKRTIESSLGYGYQSFFNVQQRPPKYEVYKYSQHDIPGGVSYKGNKNSIGLTPPASSLPISHGHQPIDIQKSVRYDLGSTKPEFIPNAKLNLNQYYQPGTTLFSTLDQQGHIGGLSAQAPQHHPGDAMVPVIILRVFTNQLTQPGALHANIPQNHPYANINNIDLQNLLAGYVQNHYQGYQDQGYYYPQQPQQHHDDGLQTHENYPDDAHTRVIFHKEAKTKVKSTTVKTPAPAAPQKFKITIPENTFSKVEIEDHSYDHQQQDNQGGYYYESPQQYYQPQAQEYQAPVQYQDAKQYVQIQTYPQYENQAPAQTYHSQQNYASQPTQAYLPQQAQQQVYVTQNHQPQQVYYQPAYEQPQSYQEQAYSGYEQVYQAPQTQDHQTQQKDQSYQEHAYQPQKEVQSYHSQSQSKHQTYHSQPQKDVQTYESPLPQKDIQSYQTQNDQVYQIPLSPTYHQQQQEQKSYHQTQGYTSHAASNEQYLREVTHYPTSQDEQKISLQDVSTAIGRDLHAKLYNYHAHGPVEQPKTRSTHKKRRAKLQSPKNSTSTEKH